MDHFLVFLNPIIFLQDFDKIEAEWPIFYVYLALEGKIDLT